MYQVLYRKYRPKVFSDVVGQDHITKTLQSEIEKGKLSHAYLFTGSRGTGKTTCAKILSKAVNCLHPVDGNPCNECEICKGIDSGAILDVVEIDAASNNGVDNIRDIRDESGFAPVNCKYRVYIIDEVHMLSIGAFNALLKTLEEPPEHVMFILATTEVHKLPVTILSRCQRFDFRRVAPQDMIRRMNYIAEKENFTLDEDAAVLIARLADGGMRDALSTLDQCISASNHVTSEVVCSVAGIAGKQHLFDLADDIANHDSASALEKLSELYAASCDMERLCADLTMHFRNLMIAKTVRNAENILVSTKDELESYKKQSSLFTLEGILFSIDLLQEASANIKRSVNRRIEMEMVLIRLSSPALDSSNEAILKRISALELAVKSGSFAQGTAPQPSVQSETKKEPTKAEPVSPKTDFTPSDESFFAPPPAFEEKKPEPPKEEKRASWETPVAPRGPKPNEETASASQGDITANVFPDWAQVLSELTQINQPLWGVLIGSTAFLNGEFVLIKSENPTFASFIKVGTNGRDVKEAIYRVTGKKYRLGIYNPASTQKKEAEKPKDPLQDLVKRAKDFGVRVDVE
ncbi:MAG: DNA polymerase III subunit gamma/tau [Clostridia bacterium]|nr:DNA polymerase III subunit gamma/tau [Clostridia bacterium]